MVRNYSLTKMSVFLVMVLIMQLYIDAMEGNVFSENEVAKIRATFELGKVYALGENEKPDYEEAQKCFEEVVKADVDNESSAWSFLWLSKISLDENYKEEAQEYLKIARSYGKGIPFYRALVAFLSLPSFRDSIGKVIFSDAVREGKIAVLEFLLANGVEVDDVKEVCGRPALHLAAQKDHKKVIELLLYKGADLDAQDQDGTTAFHKASCCGHEGVVELLLQRGAKLEAKDKNFRTGLHWAVLYGHKDVVELLLNKGADLDAQDKDGNTALHLAALRGNAEIAILLVSHGAGLTIRDNYGRNAFYYMPELEQYIWSLKIKELFEGWY